LLDLNADGRPGVVISRRHYSHPILLLVTVRRLRPAPGSPYDASAPAAVLAGLNGDRRLDSFRHCRRHDRRCSATAAAASRLLPAPLAAGPGPSTVEVYDVNNDAKLDI
jgi:hypothetical protein